MLPSTVPTADQDPYIDLRPTLYVPCSFFVVSRILLACTPYVPGHAAFGLALIPALSSTATLQQMQVAMGSAACRDAAGSEDPLAQSRYADPAVGLDDQGAGAANWVRRWPSTFGRPTTVR